MPRAVVIVVLAFLAACETYVERPPAPANTGIFGFANGCYVMDATTPGSSNTRWLEASGDSFGFSATEQTRGARLRMRASALGTYLFYDADKHYLIAQDGQFARPDKLDSDVELVDDSFKSPAEWVLHKSPIDPDRFELVNYQTGEFLTPSGTTADPSEAGVVAFYPADGCADFPELTIDAEGDPVPRQWPDGDVFGIVETHTHMFSDFGFGGGGIFHGAPFHRLGVEHALPSCKRFHDEDGRRDIVGYAFGGLDDISFDGMISVFIAGATPEFNHHTDGYPTFTDWPNSWNSATHQTEYYKWVERAWRGGLRLMVNDATTNSVLCELVTGLGAQQVRYSCDDMVAVDREITEAYNLQDYIDAQSGGPGLGWFRIVKSPAEARTVINAGKLAVILGIETSNLFDCFLTPRAGIAPCTADTVRAKLDEYYAKGIRNIFPVHKFDNAFSAGDGDRRVGQLGSFINSGHDSNMVLDCPQVPAVFDHGNVTFGGINHPRDNYLDPPPHDMSGFADKPIATLQPFFGALREPALEGDYCQNAGLTALGETLMKEMMLRGMIIEVDHMPRRSLVRAYQLLEQYDYPPAATHGNSYGGEVYRLGGISKTNLGRCSAADHQGAMVEGLTARVAEIVANGGYPAQGFGFDLNGFAGGPRPRFGPNSQCTDPQSNPVTYPFTSYAGDVTFTQPHLGDRTVDFNTEGMLHIGLLPELIQDARLDGATDAQLEPLFRSAEGYLRMWERAEARGAALRPANAP